MILEFEPNPDLYEEGTTIEAMAQIECDVQIHERELQFQDCQSDIITYEIIDYDEDRIYDF
jgi:hypothetical protein